MKPQAIKAGVTYFALVFGAGFVLGALRVPFLVPRLGERLAELIEMPFMLLVIVWAARFITQKFALPARMHLRLGVGVLALGLLLGAEFLFAAVLQDRYWGASPTDEPRSQHEDHLRSNLSGAAFKPGRGRRG